MLGWSFRVCDLTSCERHLLAAVETGELVDRVDSAYPDHFRAAKSTDEIPEFEPVLYALDLILPVVNLNQSDSWIALGPAQWGALLTVAGWVFATTLVVAVTNVFRKA